MTAPMQNLDLSQLSPTNKNEMLLVEMVKFLHKVEKTPTKEQ